MTTPRAAGERAHVAVRGGARVIHHVALNLPRWEIITPRPSKFDRRYDESDAYDSLYLLADEHNLDFGEVRECMALAEPVVSGSAPAVSEAGDDVPSLRYLLEEACDLFGWSDKSAMHAAMHIRPAVLNLRADNASAPDAPSEGERCTACGDSRGRDLENAHGDIVGWEPCPKCDGDDYVSKRDAFAGHVFSGFTDDGLPPEHPSDEQLQRIRDALDTAGLRLVPTYLAGSRALRTTPRGAVVVGCANCERQGRICHKHWFAETRAALSRSGAETGGES